MQEYDYTPQNDTSVLETYSPSKQIKSHKKRLPHSLFILLLMLISFVIGWRFMAYKWWPVLSPYAKQAIYKIMPSMKPEEPEVTVEEYNPRCDAKVGDPIYTSDSVFYYFYFPTCPYCTTYGNTILAGLPEYITLPDGSKSRVVMISLNKHNDTEFDHISSYYESHNIIKTDEQNDQIVPSIVIGDTYLKGSDEIRDNFYRMLLNGDGQSTKLIDGASRVE